MTFALFFFAAHAAIQRRIRLALAALVLLLRVVLIIPSPTH